MSTMKAARRDLLVGALRADRNPGGSPTAAVARGSGIDRRRVGELLTELELEGLVSSQCRRVGGRFVRFWSIRRGDAQRPDRPKTPSDEMAWTPRLTAEQECLSCILWCHKHLPEDADFETRAAWLDANAPRHWGRRDWGWRTWLRCRKAYLSLLWPGKPAPELTPDNAPLLFWRWGGRQPSTERRDR